MIVIRPASEADLPGMLAIYNGLVLHSSAIWDETPVDLANRRAWYESRRARCYPVLVAEFEDRVAGYASFGDFRPFEGYRFTVEHSVYVAEHGRRRGIATGLLKALIENARTMRKHIMVGGIEANNAPSLALHEKFGFVQTARMPAIGHKFGRWLDLVFVQKVL